VEEWESACECVYGEGEWADTSRQLASY